MKLRDAIDAFLLNLEDRALSYEYISSVALRLERMAKNFPDQVLSELKRRDINRHFRDLKRAGLSEGTRAGHAASVKAFFNYCVKCGYLSDSPAVNLPKLSFKPVHRRAAPEADVIRLAHAIDKFAARRNYHLRDVKEALAVSFAVDSGARLGEIQSLRWADVRHALAHGRQVKNGRMVYIVISYGKTEGSLLRFFSETAELFLLWEKLNPWKKSPFVFCSLRSGEQQQASSLGRAFENICKFANIPPFRSQALRKRNVTYIIKITGDWKAGQMLAGHSNISVTMDHYNDILFEDMDDNVAKMADARRGKARGELLAAQLFNKRKQ